MVTMSISRLGRTLALFIAIAWIPQSLYGQFGQQSRAVPREDYYRAFLPFYDGEYRTAASAFTRARRSGIRSTEGRWVDSICYETMLGECHYQMGSLTDALGHYNNALRLLITHRNWLQRIKFEDVNPEQRTVRPVPWGPPSRNVRLARVPARMSSFQGRIDNRDVVRSGGVVMPAQLFPLYVEEIVRCSAIALRRRAEIMGPACQYDPMSSELVDALAGRPAPQRHWSQSWISLQLGLAYAGVGKRAEASQELQNSVLLLGQFDHRLSALALLELGKLAYQEGQFETAATMFREASISAGFFDQPFSQYLLIEEALRWGAVTHQVTGKPGVYPPLAAAAVWAKRERIPPLESSTWISAAEAYTAADDPKKAATALEQARRAMRRSDLSNGTAGARLEYQAALAAFQQGELQQGWTSFGKTMAFLRGGSQRLFQIALADKLIVSGTVSNRVGGILYEQLLREPSSRDWAQDPMETFAVVTTPLLGPLDNWFEIALERKEQDTAIAITDRIRRHRFYSTQRMGGRALALRWILEAPPAALSQAAMLQRQDLAVKQPAYVQLSERGAAVEQQLAALPLVPTTPDEQRSQTSLLEQLSKISLTKEQLIHSVALKRQASEFVFPPQLPIDTIQQRLQPGQRVLSFYAGSRNVYGFLISRDNYTGWRVESARSLRGDISKLLRQLGNYERNQPVDADELLSEAWKEPAEQLLQQLTGNVKADFWSSFDELVVVPDGILWYLPFEMLQVRDGDDLQPLIKKVRIRYAPTLGLAVPDERGHRPSGRTAVVTGRLFPRDADDVAEAEFKKLQDVLPESTALPTKLTAPSHLVGALCDRLIVLSDIEPARTAFSWSPVTIDRGRPGSTLEDWMMLPWRAPDQIVLPGFNTGAANALKANPDGSELFLSICGLMASGTRTILISRWRTGGQTSYDLVREFAQELPHTSAAAAWRRSVELAMAADIDQQLEPRVKQVTTDRPLTAEHPFFWAGYLLADPGQNPKD